MFDGFMKHSGHGGAVMKTGRAWRPLLAAGDAGGVAREPYQQFFEQAVIYVCIETCT